MNAVRVRARGDDWLYDCHGQRFAEAGHGASVTSGFVPLYLAQLFGVPIRRWPELLTEVQAASRDPARFGALVRGLRPRRSPRAAAEVALLVYPSVERFIERTDGRWAPFRLRSRYAMQANVPLGPFEIEEEGRWRALSAPPAAIEVPCGAPAPGVYATGHSSLLVRGRDTGLVIDPVPLSPMAATGGAPVDARTLAAVSDGVALTHAHYDHYHLPSLLALGARPVIVPRVPEASIVCEDVEARLLGHGLEVEAPAWGARLELGELGIDVLPFVGEQFLSVEEDPRLRSWGNLYVVDTGSLRVLVAADAGFEYGRAPRSVLEEVRAYVAEHGPVDVVAAQALALRTTFGHGDPDLQLTALTCPHRAEEAFELLAWSRRVTMGPEDVAELAAIAGARAVLAYGQFAFDRDAPATDPAIVSAIRDALDARGLTHVAAPSLRIGRGIGVAGEPVELALC